MSIQWYPGHMHKASKEMKEILPKMALVIEILDARIPFSSENPMLARLRGDKPCIKVLSKSDLADPAVTAQWQTYLEQEKGVKTLALTTLKPEKMRQIPELCRKMLQAKTDSVKSLNVLIVGIPNVGKSSLINILAGRNIAKTGNEPAVTKRQQRIEIADNIVLADTPGVLWPKVENENSGYRLAVTGAIKDTAMEYEDVAMFAGAYLLSVYSDRLIERYQLQDKPNSELELLQTIGQKRGCLGPGGRVDLNKVGKILLSELRSGFLGQVSLETPAMINAELEELAIISARKAEQKVVRKKRWKNK